MTRFRVFVCGVGVTLSVLLAQAQTGVSGVFFNEGWESGARTQSFNSQSYGTASGSQYHAQNAFAVGGSWAFEHRLTTGLTPGLVQYATQHFGDSIAGPVLAAGRGQRFDDLYVQYKVAYTPGFDFGTGIKQIIIGTQDERRHEQPCCNPWVAHYLTIYPPHPSLRGLLGEVNNKQAASGQWIGFSQNQSGYSQSNPLVIQTGRWYTVEVRRRLNDSGVDNGVFQMWIDGTLMSEYRNVRYRVPFNGTYGANFSYGTNFAMISNYPGSNVSRDQSVFYDDFKMSTTPIGVGSGGLTPPAAPSNLRLITEG